jgi:hydroxyacylglutathione hydrolase
MIFRPYCYDDYGCAAYVFGCGTLGACAVVDARLEDVEWIGAMVRADR